jgi:hypothetical protein
MDGYADKNQLTDEFGCCGAEPAQGSAGFFLAKQVVGCSDGD